MSELKPCPFCGGEIEIRQRGKTPFNVFACVGGCLSGGLHTVSPQEDLESSVEQWNNRPIEDALRAQLAETEVKLHAAIETGVKFQEQLETSQQRVKELEDQRKLYREALWRAKTICETYFELTNIADMKRLGEAIEKEAKAILQKGKDNEQS